MVIKGFYYGVWLIEAEVEYETFRDSSYFLSSQNKPKAAFPIYS